VIQQRVTDLVEVDQLVAAAKVAAVMFHATAVS
jgi:hypothetical protein